MTSTTPAKPEGGLKILIAGGGIGGLTAAIALRKQGHEVKVRWMILSGQLDSSKQ